MNPRGLISIVDVTNLCTEDKLLLRGEECHLQSALQHSVFALDFHASEAHYNW
jgi:hypothetical protein